MQGKHVAITGPTAGIGHSSALHLSGLGAQLTLFCRDPQKADTLKHTVIDAGGLPPNIIIMDMASLDSVRGAAQALLDLQQPLDVLLNNAGVVITNRKLTVDGFEETLAVNHFAPFLLTGLLLPVLKPTARIVNVASDAHSFAKSMGFADMQAEQGYKTFREYGRSKLANILFTRSLAQRLSGTNITVNCLHPGAVSSSLGSQNSGLLSKLIPILLKPFFLSPDQGAETSIYLCTSPEVATTSGAYFVKCRERSPKPWALDDEAAARLWDFTEECVGFKYPS
jgi:NAD(P)-dependent dehydrogenase (short-subunit alcohol dehydrogenase family)